MSFCCCNLYIKAVFLSFLVSFTISSSFPAGAAGSAELRGRPPGLCPAGLPPGRLHPPREEASRSPVPGLHPGPELSSPRVCTFSALVFRAPGVHFSREYPLWGAGARVTTSRMLSPLGERGASHITETCHRFSPLLLAGGSLMSWCSSGKNSQMDTFVRPRLHSTQLVCAPNGSLSTAVLLPARLIQTCFPDGL